MRIWRDLLEKWGLSQLSLKTPFLEAKFEPNDPARRAAWELYVELMTRVTTQPLYEDEGDEAAALSSLTSLFSTTREILRESGPRSVDTAYIAIAFLNQVLRPLTAKWHSASGQKALSASTGKAEFRTDLERIRKLLLGYTDLMGELSGIEPSGSASSLQGDGHLAKR